MKQGFHKKGTNPICGSIIVGICLVLFVLVGATAAVAAPKRLATAKPGDCAACHGTQKVLPADHKSTKAMTYQGCLECHDKKGGMTLWTKMPLAHMHQLAGVNCQKCHGKTKKPEEVPMSKCVTCHNVDKVAEKTASVKPQNPHESVHYGRNLDCNLCHREHGKSENYCAQCHSFKFVVP